MARYIDVGVTAKVNDDNTHITIKFDSDPNFVISMMRGDDGAVDSFMIERTLANGVKRQRLYPYDGISGVKVSV